MSPPRRLAGALMLGVALAAVVAGEVLVSNDLFVAAQILDAVLVVIALNASGAFRPSRPDVAAAMAALAVVAAVRVASVGLPLRSWDPGVGEIVIGALAAISVIVGMPATGRTRKDALEPGAARWQLAATIAGGGFGALVYLAGASARLAPGPITFTRSLILAGLVVTAIAEELLFRALLQRALQGWLPRAGPLLAAGVFAAMYVSVDSTALVIVMAMAGVVFGIVVSRTDAIGAAAVGHVALVVSAAVIWPYVFDDRHPWDPTAGATLALSAGLAILVVLAWRVGGERTPAPSHASPTRR